MFCTVLPSSHVSGKEIVINEMTDGNSLHDVYDVKGKLGRGGSAKVYELVNKSSSTSFACKVVSKKRYTQEKIYREIKMLSEMRHDNIVSFIEYYENKRDIFIIMQHCRGGELFQALRAHGKFSEETARNIIRPIISAVQYLHARTTVHRDIKLENILLAETRDNFEIKSSDVLLVDFGLAKDLKVPQGRTYSLCGSQYYVAPEVWLGRGYGLQVDMWGIGVVLYMILTNTPPFYETEGMTLKQAIISGNYTTNNMPVSESAQDLVRKMLTLNPSKRIMPDDALAHKWFENCD